MSNQENNTVPEPMSENKNGNASEPSPENSSKQSPENAGDTKPEEKTGEKKDDTEASEVVKGPSKGAIIKEKLAPVFAKIKKLRQKRFWIPLVVGHALMFSGMAYFAYEEIRYKRTPEYLLETLHTTLTMNDPVLLSSVFNASIFIKNVDKTIRSNINKYPDLARYIGDLSNEQAFNKSLSSLLLNIVRAKDSEMPFDKKINILPAKLASQIRATPFTIHKRLSDPTTETYVLKSKLKTIKWGTYPLLLTAHIHNDAWCIKEITNLDEILALYDTEIKKQRLQKEKRILAGKAAIVKSVQQYLPDMTCSATITELSGSKLLLIRADAKANNSGDDIISWAADATISFEDGSLFKEEYLKINRLFPPDQPISHTWNIILTDEEIATSLDKKLICSPTPLYVNLPNGEFHQISE